MSIITTITTMTTEAVTMNIDWLEAESAIDDRLALGKRREELESKLADAPEDPEIAYQLLNVMDQLEVPPNQMAAAVEAAFTASPNHAGLMAWLGQLSYRLGDLKVSMLTLKQAITLDKEDPIANFTLAQIMLYTGTYKDGLMYAERAWDLGKASHFVKEIGRVYCITLARLGRWDEAVKFQEERLKEYPTDSQTIIDTSDIYSETGKLVEAIKMLKEAVKANPSDTDLLMRLAIHYFEADKYAEAREWADKVIEADSQHLEGWNLRAQIRLKAGDPRGALEDHGMISELSKSMPLDQAFRAECLMMLGQKEVAIDALKQGMEEVKDWPDRLKIYKQMLERIQVVRPSESPGKATPKLGPNDPCHCGSGKKFKKCHG
ncbi:MAG: tetratricopeptide repeat protein [Planctomycetota bacterium]|jgi:tetratricopeptide (TPR) repeat protein